MFLNCVDDVFICWIILYFENDPSRASAPFCFKTFQYFAVDATEYGKALKRMGVLVRNG